MKIEPIHGEPVKRYLFFSYRTWDDSSDDLGDLLIGANPEYHKIIDTHTGRLVDIQAVIEANKKELKLRYEARGKPPPYIRCEMWEMLNNEK